MKTLADVIKFVNEYWVVLQSWRQFNSTTDTIYREDIDTLTSSGDF